MLKKIDGIGFIVIGSVLVAPYFYNRDAYADNAIGYLMSFFGLCLLTIGK